MRKVTRQQARTGRPWTGADRMRLELMAEHQIPAERIAQKLRRTEAAVRTEARKQRVMLAPSEKQLSLTNKRPYGGMAVAPRRSLAKATAPGRPSRSRPSRPEPSEQAETLF
ncbi:MAG: hypothetical protein JHC98_01725 [Thermoleophilaceae bacterium]|nr:hypothetical protein [Thermoleophilaceae bacterium]